MFGSDWFFDILNSVFEWLQQKASDQGIEFSKFDLVKQFDHLWSYMKLANQILPFQECFSILFGGFAAKVSIRAVRWVLSFIPTSNQ